MQIAVLALQGAFREHEQALSRLGIDSFEIRQRRDLEQPMDGLILPGGESTAQGRLLRELGLLKPLWEIITAGLPVFGTCAGLLLLAKRIANDARVHFATMELTAMRNAYGRQLGSFYTTEEFHGIGPVPMPFIRAPYIETVGDGVRILARVDGKIVAAQQGNQLVTAFHPELSDSLAVHSYFINLVERHALV